MRKRHLLFSILVLSIVLHVPGTLRVVTAQTPPAWALGDVFVAVGNGQYKVYHNNGTASSPNYVLIETLSDGTGGTFTTGCAFDTGFNLYTTDFTNTKVVKFDANSPHSVLQTIDTNAQDPAGHSESMVFDASNNFYVGDPDGGRLLLKYNSMGTFVTSFAPAKEFRGTDWVELASDQKTIFYTSEGTHVKRFDVSANLQLTDFNSTALPATAFALRLLPPFDGSGGLLAADSDRIVRLDGTGADIQEYKVTSAQICPTTSMACPNENTLFALNLDPNGTSFWAGAFGTANFYRFNISTGAIEVGPINTGTGASTLFGICLKGQGTASSTTQPVAPGVTTTFTFGNVINQMVAVPSGTNMNGTAFMQTSFVEIAPATFNSTRLPATAPNTWSGGTAVPAGTVCTPINPDQNCIVIQNRCFASDGTPITPCNIIAPTGSLIGLTSHYKTSSPQPCPLLATASDGGNDWANITYGFNPADPTISGGTKGLNSDEFIGELPSPCGSPSFLGFFSPVANPPVVNLIKAGQTVPVKWQVLNANGLGVAGLTLAPGGTVSLSASSTACTAGAVDNTIPVTASGSSGLQDLGGGNYQFNWSTGGLPSGACVDLAVNPGDTTLHHAFFQTK